MYHGLTHEAIYAAVRTVSVFDGRHGDVKEISGTSFALLVEGKTVLVTNRHIVDLNFGRTDGKYVGFTLRHLICEVRARDSKDGTPGENRSYVVPMTHNEILYDSNPLNDVAVIFDVQSGNLDGSENRRWEYCFEYSDVATEEELRDELQPFDVLAFPGFPGLTNEDYAQSSVVEQWPAIPDLNTALSHKTKATFSYSKASVLVVHQVAQ